MSRFNSTQADSANRSPGYARSFNSGGGALELEVRDAEERRIALLVTRACEQCTAGMATEDKQDVSQNAAFGLIRRIRKGLVLSDDDIVRYAFVATQRAHLKIYRTEQRRAAFEARLEEVHVDETPQWQDASHRVDADAISNAYENIARRMPKEWRSAFEAIQLRGESFDEVSKATGVSVTALRKRVGKAQEYLKVRFIKQETEEQSGAANVI